MAALSADIAEARRLEQAGKLPDAEAVYLAILKRQPRDVAALNLLGLLQHRQGRNGEAADLIGRAVALQPDDVQALQNLGAVQMALGNGVAAIAGFRRATVLAPRDASAWRNLGLALLENQETRAAADAYRQAQDLDPHSAAGLQQLARALFSAGDAETAAEVYARIALANSDQAENWSNLGAARHRAGDLAGAETALNEALRLEIGNAAAWCNLGAVANDRGRDDDAIANFSRAIEIEPNHVDAHVFRGTSLLRQGRFAEGWADYDWRLKQRRGPRVDRGLAQPRWQGEDFAGRRLMIHAEQGLGDTIQFMRYLPMVKARGGDVIFEVQPPLYRLIAASPAMRGFEVIAEGAPLPAFDLFCPLLSLPGIFATDLSSIPGGVPYLTGDPALMPALPPLHKQRRWALVWAGNPRHPADRLRSLPATALDRLTGLRDVEFVSLQIAARVKPERLTLIDAAPLLADFAVTAALLAEVGLVITVDTAVAHLAGAMGKPTWLLLPHVADWRWMNARRDSPWYPSLGLYRQPRPGDWTSVIERIADEAAQGS
jgi:Flp pilus assembly protein TadD